MFCIQFGTYTEDKVFRSMEVVICFRIYSSDIKSGLCGVFCGFYLEQMKKHAIGGCWMYDIERFLKWLHGKNVSCILGWLNWGKKVVSHFFPSSKLPVYFICMTRG